MYKHVNKKLKISLKLKIYITKLQTKNENIIIT